MSNNGQTPTPNATDEKFYSFSLLTSVNTILQLASSTQGINSDPDISADLMFLRRHVGGVLVKLSKQLFKPQNQIQNEQEPVHSDSDEKA